MAALAVAIASAKHPSSAWFVVGLSAFGLGLILYFVGFAGPHIPRKWFHPITTYRKAHEPHEETMREFLDLGGPDADAYRAKMASELMLNMRRARESRVVPRKPTELMKPTSLRCGLCGSLLSRRADGTLFCPQHST